MDLQNLPSILTPDLGLLFWMLLAFLVIFFVLAKYGFPVVTKMVEERKAYIDDSLKKAHEANEKLANIQQEGENLLKEARERQQQILTEAAQTRDAIVEKAQMKAREEMPLQTFVNKWLNSVYRLPRRCSARNSLQMPLRCSM